MSQQINLDNGEGQISSGLFTDDIYKPCTELNVSFDCREKLNFNDNSEYFTYKKADWIPVSYYETQTPHKTWHYDISAYPKQIYNIVSKPCSNTFELAASSGLILLPESQSLKFKYPILNEPLGRLVNHYRYMSLEDAYRNMSMGDAHFIYFNSTNMLSMTWSKLIHQKSLKFESHSEIDSSIIKRCDDRILCDMITNHRAKPLEAREYYLKLFGRKWEVISTSYFQFARMYTLSFSDVPELDTNCDYLCIKASLDVMETAGFHYIFSEVTNVR